MKPLREWQKEALDKWRALGRRGVIEAVTGSGKTEVGIAATLEAVADGQKVLVVVPSRDLLRQWYERLLVASTTLRVGRRGDGIQDSFRHFDVLVSTVQSAVMPAAERPPAGALIVADEVHRYAAESFAKVLSESFDARLGLTATLERSDDGIEQVLKPFFENVIEGCTYQRGYADGILAPVNLALVPVPFSPKERARYENLDEVARAERSNLITKYGCRAEPFGSFLQDVQLLAKDEFGGDSSVWSARKYLKAFSERRDLLATISGKEEALADIAPGLERSNRSLVFAETKAAAARAAEVLLQAGVAAAPYTSDLNRNDRIALLQTFKDGRLTTLAAPRVLDEGVDVPEADVGIVLAASRTRRQMIQRMGRVIRPKADGRAAVFIIFYAEGSSEDPEKGAHGTFLDELADIAQTVEKVEVHSVPALLEAWLPPTDGAGRTMTEIERGMAVNAANQVAKHAAAVQKVSAHIRGVVADTTRLSRPGALDDVLAALVDLDPDEAEILIYRFGLNGEEPLDHDSIAARLGKTSDEVIQIGDNALEKLHLPHVGEPVRRAVQNKVDNDDRANQHDARLEQRQNDADELRHGSDIGEHTTTPKTPKIQQSPVTWPKPGPVELMRQQRVGPRKISLPTKGSGTGSQHVQYSNPANKVAIHMECDGGFIPSAVIDIGDWSVILDEPVAGRRRFEDPSEAAVALLQFYGFADDEEVDGWTLWKIKDTGHPIDKLRRSSVGSANA
ncbi:DEAD/DEAH box helicase family protein [Gordonia paraffinivorans]|uniref:DEAD/DEAH box helicase family protein n=1 Tax=Gordonia paraffinivorans TaxID=175628 RepID=UPI00289BF1E6|nr:DEAD/DEAH box helicase family protein [Gordonia paraffinivorans]